MGFIRAIVQGLGIRCRAVGVYPKGPKDPIIRYSDLG